MPYDPLRFLDLEYWFCLIYGLFGGTCKRFETEIDASISATDTATSTPLYSGLWGALVGATASIWGVIGGFVLAFWAIFSIIAFSISALLVLVIAGSILGLLSIRYMELAKYGQLPPEVATAHHMRGRWQELLGDAMSTDPKRWREGILTADIFLGELLGSLGYPGADTEAKLTNVPEDAFVTLPVAWEAHRIRNFIAAGSSDFILTQREAFRVMKLYEQVFEEFQFV